MSTAPMSTTSPPVPWRKIHALGLPGGSVRALLALAVLGSIWGLIYFDPDGGVPYYLQNLMFIILGHYFAARHRYDPADIAGPPPLFLPKGSVRLLLVAGFVVLAIVLAREGRVAHDMPNQALFTLLLVAGFFLGVALSHALEWWRGHGHRVPKIVEDVRSLVCLAAAALLIAFLFRRSIAGPEVLERVNGFIDRHRGGEFLATVVGFYFGSRS